MRVISGEFGSRPLKAVPGQNTRPTTDKIKESIFNLIQPFYENNQCLDFYGGTGAIGIEAVSRGFEHSVIIEKDRKAIQTIKDNIKMTIDDGYLTINAKQETNNDEKDKHGKYVRRERYYGECSRSFYVGEDVKEEDIKAKYTDGTLKVEIPKVEPKKELEEKKYIEIE